MEAILSKFRNYLVEHGYSDRTVEAYLGTLNRHLEGICRMEGYSWNDPRIASSLEKWASSLRNQAVSGKISDSTVRTDIAAIRSFYLFCTNLGVFTASPAAGLRGLVLQSRLPRPVPLEDVEKLLGAIPVSSANLEGVRDRAVMELFLNGLRNVEVCRLRTQDVRFVPQEDAVCVTVMGKGRVEGEVFLSAAASFFVTKYLLAVHGHNVEGLTPEEIFQEFVTHSPAFPPGPAFRFGGTPPTRGKLNYMFRKYRGKAELSASYGPHSLRHTCATELLNSGTDISVVRDVLRHKSIVQTLQYARIQRGAKAAATRRLPTYGVLK